MEPNLAAYTAFLLSVCGFPQAVLNSNSALIQSTYNVAQATVLADLGTIGFTDPFTGQQSSMGALALYNYGAALFIVYAADPNGAAAVPGSNSTDNPSGLPFCAYTRSRYNINGYVSGTIQSASDETTSQSMVVPDAAAGFTFDDLEVSKTPYGRRYLAIAQSAGSSLYGLV